MESDLLYLQPMPLEAVVYLVNLLSLALGAMNSCGSLAKARKLKKRPLSSGPTKEKICILFDLKIDLGKEE